jgi:hypothetical protein
VSDTTGKLKGTLHGATWIAGRSGAGLRFDGGNTWVDLPNTPALDTIADGSYTIMAWFKPEDIPPGKDSENSSAYGIVQRMGLHGGLTYGNTGAFVMMQWFVKPGTTADKFNSSSGTRAFPPGVFYHVAGTIDRASGQLTIIVNGNVEGGNKFDPTSRAWSYGDVPWRLGIGGPGYTEWRWCAKGVIDDVRFYNRALSVGEIAAIYRSTGTAPPLKTSPDARPWKPIFDGQTNDCICIDARNDWPVKDGAITNLPGKDNAAQTKEEFGDGEVRVRFESRGNSVLWFNMRQQGAMGYAVDLKPYPELQNQKEHELLFTMRGPSVIATVDGKPIPVTANGTPSRGLLQFNCSVDGSLRIKSMDYRELK